MRNKPPLGQTSLEQFMSRHWQRRPLLMRQAIPGFESPVSVQRLFEIARDEQDPAESRLIRRQRGRWSLTHGPFAADELALAGQRQWTLLVQGMDLHDDAIRALLDRFRFIADARLDDLMISYAVDGGGVGPHLDSYDVFLLQARGRRHWRWGLQADNALQDGVPLKLLREFTPTDEAVLEPGDMLYLPPGWAHDGVALGECMTFSIGFRSPSRHELLHAWLADCADSRISGPDPRFRDPGVKATASPARIPDAMHQQLSDWITQWRADPKSISRFIGRFLTEPKPNVWFDAAQRTMSSSVFARSLARKGLRADRRSRLAYRDNCLFINGECVEPAAQWRPLLRRLADRRCLEPQELAGRIDDPALLELLHEWFEDGWIRFATHPPASGAQPRRKRQQ
jgi:50S ribosomal protein L16 3-hydroxylase